MFTKVKLFNKEDFFSIKKKIFDKKGNFEFQRFYTTGGDLAGILVMNWCMVHFLFLWKYGLHILAWNSYTFLIFLFPNFYMGCCYACQMALSICIQVVPLLKQLFLNSWEPSHVLPCPPTHTCVSVKLMCLATSPSIPPTENSRRLLQMFQGIHGRQALVVCLKLKTVSPSIQI